MARSRSRFLTVSLASATLVLGCSRAPAPPAELPVAGFAIRGGSLTGPDTVTAGWIEVRLEVGDGILDQVTLVRLGDGHGVEEFLTATEVAYPPFWAHFSGGPAGVLPGSVGTVTMQLEAGQWLALAFDIGPEGFPRVRHQLTKPFTVVAGADAGNPPAAPFQLALYDYGFRFSAPLVAGTQVVEVTNLAPQRHEAILVELPEGTSADAMAAWLRAMRRGEAAGPAPGRVVSGVAALSQSTRNFWTVTVARGNYALICLLADDGDGRPHIDHGQIQRFEVLEALELIQPDSL